MPDKKKLLAAGRVHAHSAVAAGLFDFENVSKLLAGCHGKCAMGKNNLPMVLIYFQNHNKSRIGFCFISRMPQEKYFGSENQPDRSEHIMVSPEKLIFTQNILINEGTPIIWLSLELWPFYIVSFEMRRK